MEINVFKNKISICFSMKFNFTFICVTLFSWARDNLFCKLPNCNKVHLYFTNFDLTGSKIIDSHHIKVFQLELSWYFELYLADAAETVADLQTP